MAQLSKTGRFIIVFLAFTAGALVAVVALSNVSSDKHILLWQSRAVETIRTSQPPLSFRCEGLATIICVEIIDANLDIVRPAIYKRDSNGQYAIQRDPLPKPPTNAPAVKGTSVFWRVPDGAYILRFETIPANQPETPALSPSSLSLPTPSSFNIRLHTLGGKFVR